MNLAERASISMLFLVLGLAIQAQAIVYTGSVEMNFGSCEASAMEESGGDSAGDISTISNPGPCENCWWGLNSGWRYELRITYDDCDDYLEFGEVGSDVATDCSGSAALGSFKLAATEGSGLLSSSGEPCMLYAIAERDFDLDDFIDFTRPNISITDAYLSLDYRFYSNDFDRSWLELDLYAYLLPYELKSGGLYY